MSMTCMRKHAEPVDGCRSCRLLATSDSYRAAVAKLRNQPRPPSVGEPDSRKHHLPNPTRGPGTELKRMLGLMGVPACQACNSYAAKMDAWGPAGCKDRLDEITAHLEEQGKQLGWLKWLATGAKAVTLGLPKTARGLAEEAIRLAEAPPATHRHP